MPDFTCEYCKRSDHGQSDEFPRACLTCERHLRDAANLRWVTVVETYTTDTLITAIAVRLGHPVELETVETYRGMAHEYRVRDGGTVSVTFWFGVPSATQTGKERCVIVGERCLTLPEAVEHIVSSPWQRSMEF